MKRRLDVVLVPSYCPELCAGGRLNALSHGGLKVPANCLQVSEFVCVSVYAPCVFRAFRAFWVCSVRAVRLLDNDIREDTAIDVRCSPFKLLH
eukprot:m.44673 g.44673  ORF g.44673 m.44673 type:complete len:93 (+) comp11723_c0_seq3:357-635(+)